MVVHALLMSLSTISHICWKIHNRPVLQGVSHHITRVPIKTITRSCLFEMNDFDKRMALDVIEDALTSLDTPDDRAVAFGLCGAFYMSGFLTHAEWEELLERIWETDGVASQKRWAARVRH